MTDKEVYYKDYLQLNKILNAQLPESDLIEKDAHDEMLFIIIHQAYELWFKQIIYELGSVTEMLSQPKVNDNSPDLQTIVHRGERITSILNLLVNQIDVMETMTPLDFLDFRDLLRPASGFQSYQWKQMEAMLGLKFDDRHGKGYYLSHLNEEEIEKVKQTENQPSLIELVNKWLERMPFFDNPEFWTEDFGLDIKEHPFWKNYRSIYSNSLSEIEVQNLHHFDNLFFNPEFTKERRLSNRANRSALFIMLYRGYPMLHLPFKLINLLLDIDELMATWRTRHMNMVHRMIGKRVGTGNSSGRDYLRAALDKHYIFQEVAELNTFLVERRNLPKLSPELEKRLGFLVDQ